MKRVYGFIKNGEQKIMIMQSLFSQGEDYV